MAYTITRTDGTTLLTLSDSRVDQLTTSISLIGKNVESYGQYYNNNLVGLLENFASVNQPRSPLTGQLWYNKVDGRMYVYGLESTFKPVAGALVSDTKPVSANQGDFWIDTINKQLWFTPDGTNFTLAGPQYSEITGKSGWLVETIIDTAKNPQIVASLYNNDQLLAIAATAPFVFDVPVGGMSSVQSGFNLNQSISGIRFVGTATSADSVQGFTPNDYLKTTGDQILAGGLSILNDNPGLYVGSGQDLQISVDSVFTNIIHSITDKSLRIRGVNSVQSYFTAITVDSANQRVGVFTEAPAYAFDVRGDTRIAGNLIVEGASTSIQSVNLQISDKNIELAYTSTSIYSDTLADGGGITLHGATDHTITWANNGTGWNFNDHVNIPGTTNAYKINGNAVITATSLGSVITSAPGVTKLGVLTQLTVTNVVISGSTVAATGTNMTLYLSGTGTLGTVDVSNNRLTRVATPTNNTDAANKKYVDDGLLLVGTKGFTISIDTTGMIDPETEILDYLDKLLPVSNPPGFEYLNLVTGTRVRALCSSLSIAIPASPTQLVDLNYSSVQVKDINNNTQTVISQAGLVGSIPSTTQIIPTVTRVVKQYIVNGSLQWQYDGDIA